MNRRQFVYSGAAGLSFLARAQAEQAADQKKLRVGMIGCGFGPTATAKSPEGTWAHDAKGGRYIPTEEDNPAFLGPAGTNPVLGKQAAFASPNQEGEGLAHAQPANRTGGSSRH